MQIINFQQQNYKFINVTTLKTSATKYILWLLPLITFSIPLSTSLTSILMLTFLLLWLVEGNYTNKIKMLLNYNYLIISLIIISLFLGSLYSIAPYKDILLYLKKMHKLLYVFLLDPYFKEPKVRKNCINSFIISALISIAIGLYLYSPAVFKNSIDTSLIASLTSFFLMHALINRINAEPSKKFNLLNICNFVVILASVFYLFAISISRSSHIIFCTLVIIFIFQRFKVLKKYYILSTIIISLIIINISALFIINRDFNHLWINAIKEYKEFNFEKPKVISPNQRRIYYINSLELIKEHPVLGTGTGSFPIAYKNFVIKHKLFNMKNEEYLFINNPHNEYLLFGVQFGIYGILLLLSWLIQLFKFSYKINANLQERYILQGLVINMFIGCCLNSWLLDFTAGHLFIIFTAICLGASTNENTIRFNRTIIRCS